MHVLVEISNDEDLVVVADWLAPEELLRLAEGGLMLCDLVCLRVENKAVRYPSIVTSKYHDLRVIKERKAAKSVASRPLLIFVNQWNDLPLLVLKSTWATLEPIKALNAIEWCLSQAVSSTNDIEISVVKNSD
jgi:hypothetical protein